MRLILPIPIFFLAADSSFAQRHLAEQLRQAYPDFVVGYQNGNLLFKDGSTLPFDDGKKNKTVAERLNNADIEDQFFYEYPKGKIFTVIPKYSDPGRIRNEAFFRKMYGGSAAEVAKHLTTIVWCPRTVGQRLQVTTVNNVDKALLRVSAELDQRPELKQYLSRIGGTFNWRLIAGTNRLSMHSFGMTIDINTKYSDYWQWHCKCTNERTLVPYRNQIPQVIIDAFEKNGFIWGGKWYHFDTMHFEYRPELLTP